MRADSRGDCDCDGNVKTWWCVTVRAADEDGSIDDEDDWVGAYDACGVCVDRARCSDADARFPGRCDCQGNVDAVGLAVVMPADINGDGICDDDTSRVHYSGVQLRPQCRGERRVVRLRVVLRVHGHHGVQLRP